MAESLPNPTILPSTELDQADHREPFNAQSSAETNCDEETHNYTGSTQPTSGKTMGNIVKLVKKISRSEDQCGELLRHNSGLLQVLDEDHPMAARLQVDNNNHHDMLGQTSKRVELQKALVRRKSGVDENAIREAALRDEFRTIKGLEQQIDAATSRLVSATRPTTSRNQLNHGRIARSLSWAQDPRVDFSTV